MALRFDGTIKAGDVLTSFAVFISALTLLFSFAKDQEIRVREDANRVRTAVATTIVKLDRWQALQLSLYQELQPTFVELSEDLAESRKVEVIRDKFWKQVNSARTKVASQVLEEQLSTAYADLLTHFPSARLKVVDAFSALADAEKRSTNMFMSIGQKEILSVQDNKLDHQTAYLGNLLRDAGNTGAEQLKNDSDKILIPFREYLFQVIAMSDAKLVNIAR